MNNNTSIQEQNNTLSKIDMLSYVNYLSIKTKKLNPLKNIVSSRKNKIRQNYRREYRINIKRKSGKILE